jgi:hypothetical protein
MAERPKMLYLLIALWVIFSLIFISIGYASLDLASNIYKWFFTEELYFGPMLFFVTFFLTIVMFVFGSIFLIFAYETFKRKRWVWNAGIIISTIFIVIFSFMLASLMITALIFMDNFSIPTLITVMIAFLVDLGIIFSITRPSVKEYLHDQV